MNKTETELIKTVHQLTEEQQEKLLEFVRSLIKVPSAFDKKAEIKALSGSITKEDAELMRKVIEEDCERIDEKDWK